MNLRAPADVGPWQIPPATMVGVIGAAESRPISRAAAFTCDLSFGSREN